MDNQQGRTVKRLWANGRDAVKAFVAEMAVRNLLMHEPPLTLRLRPDGADMLMSEGSRSETAHSVSGRPHQAVKDLLTRHGIASGTACGLEFAPGLAITSRMILPAESPDVLKAIVRNKVEGIAPWPLSQSLFGHRSAAIPGDPAHVAVDVAVVSRALLEETTDRLAASGVVVKAASVQLRDGQKLRIDVGAEEEIRRASARALRLGWGVATLAGIVAAAGLGVLWFSWSQATQYQQKAADLMASLKSADTAQAGTPLLAAASSLHQRRRERPPVIAVIDEVSKLLPQTVWLEGLSLDNARLELKGQGSGIPALIDILEQSGSFRDVNFASATQRNADLNADAFSIEATLDQSQAGVTP